MTWDVLVTCPIMVQALDDYREHMSQRKLSVFEVQTTQQLRADELLAVISRFDAVIAGDDEFNGDVLRMGAGGKLKVISKWGVGTDNIDLDAAKSLGIAVTNTPGLLGDEVADVALGYIILLARQLHRIDQAVRRGDWYKPTGESLAGKVLGIVGAGSIGRALTQRALGVGMNVVVSDPSAEALDVVSALGAMPTSLDVLVTEADYVVLACPLTPETFKIVNSYRIALMKPTACVVNVSRGDLVDERALIEALENRRLRGAALDVFENEPLALDNPLSSLDQVILGSHNAANTKEAIWRVSNQAIENVVSALSAHTGGGS